MIYVDDGGIFSSDENIKEVLKEVRKTFVVDNPGTPGNIFVELLKTNQKQQYMYIKVNQELNKNTLVNLIKM
jgi:hypothetical protein